MTLVAVTGSFDDMRSQHIRFLHEASRLGSVHVLLWSDEMVKAVTGRSPKFPQAERLYLLQSIRYVDNATVIEALGEPDVLPGSRQCPDLWVVSEGQDHPEKLAGCTAHGVGYRVLRAGDLQGFPEPDAVPPSPAGRKKVFVTGCYDWFHSGHVRFFEECAALGDLYVGLGNDANVELLKGPGHPLFPQEERRYVVASIRCVTCALVNSGSGWMDAAPDIERIRPDYYVVNEDGDKPDKRAFCREHGLEYVVFERQPKEGLPRRQSTDLRGF